MVWRLVVGTLCEWFINWFMNGSGDWFREWFREWLGEWFGDWLREWFWDALGIGSRNGSGFRQNLGRI